MKLTIVAIQYLEPEYKETLKCLSKVNVPIIFVDRKGVGSLAEAYNRGFKKVNTEYVWFISNIIFKPEVPQRLLSNVKGYAGIHPKFESHHKFIKLGRGIQKAPFLEFTAPMIRSEVFKEIGLKEEMPYWGHDIAFGMDCTKKGYELVVDHTTKVEHVYIWDSKKNPITEERKKKRLATDKKTFDYLDTHYNGWRKHVYF